MVDARVVRTTIDHHASASDVDVTHINLIENWVEVEGERAAEVKAVLAAADLAGRADVAMEPSRVGRGFLPRLVGLVLGRL